MGMNLVKRKFLSIGLITIIILVILFSNFSSNRMNWSGPNTIDSNIDLDRYNPFDRVIKSSTENSYFALIEVIYYGNHMFGTSTDLINWNFTNIHDIFGQTIYSTDFTVLSNNSIFLITHNQHLDTVGYSLSNDNGITWSEYQIVENNLINETNGVVISKYLSTIFEYDNDIYVVKTIFDSSNDYIITKMLGKLNQTSKSFDYIASTEISKAYYRGHAIINDEITILLDIQYTEYNSYDYLILNYDFLDSTWTQFNANFLQDEERGLRLYENEQEMNLVYYSNNGIFNAKLMQNDEDNEWVLQKKELVTFSSGYSIRPVENSDKKVIFAYYNSNYNFYIKKFDTLSFFYYLTISAILIVIVALPEGVTTKISAKIISKSKKLHKEEK